MTGTALGIVAAIVFVAGYFLLGIGFFASLIVAAAVYVGVTALAAYRSVKGRSSGTTDDRASRASASSAIKIDLSGLSISQEEFTAALTAGAKKLTALKNASARVSDERVRAKAYAVCDSVARILSDIREDPKDLRPARKFLDYYLDATIKVVDRYASLAAKNISTDDMQSALTRAENSLDTIKSAYDKQLEQLLENDVMDLDTELEVLERTIQMEGLGSQ
jgi:5-bromo-4-chloroindolyl phosphate hydrolysis protein